MRRQVSGVWRKVPEWYTEPAEVQAKRVKGPCVVKANNRKSPVWVSFHILGFILSVLTDAEAKASKKGLGYEKVENLAGGIYCRWILGLWRRN